jgi:cell division protein FtsZ
MFEIVEQEHAAVLKVIGIGGGGGNAVNTMIEGGLDGVEFISCNTDKQALAQSMAPCRVQLGTGLGAGGRPEVGKQSATESKDRIRDFLEGSHMVFITAGMGGGTGTGGAPVIAQIAKDLGALVVAVVTKPFLFEGRRRMRQAEEGIDALRETVDTLITIPNQKLIALAGKEMALLDAFKKADGVLLEAVRSISELITVPGLINLDFADVKNIMDGMGMALMGTGVATGENRAIEAANMAISSPLLENVAIDGAQGVLINVTGGEDLSLSEVSEAASLIQDAVNPNANIIFGSVLNRKMTDEIRITVIATGFDHEVASLSPSTEFKAEPKTRRVSYLQEKMAQRAEEARTQRSSILERSRTTDPVFTNDNTPLPKAASAVSYRNSRYAGPDSSDPCGPTADQGRSASIDDDEYDIPTFLRRQPD